MPKLGSIVPDMENRTTTAGPFDKAVAGALRSAIGERFMTQADVAKRAGVAPRTFARYFMGTSPMPVAKLVEVCDAIGVDPGEILNAARVILERTEKEAGRKVE